jgi:hypothetical protein
MAGERTSFRRRIAVALATAGVVSAVSVGAGAAYAYWTSQGGGNGSAITTTGASATVHVIAVTGGTDPSTLLSPGQTAELVLELSNPNSYPVTIAGIAQDGDVTPSGGSGPGAACTGGSSGNTGVSVPTQAMSVPLASGGAVSVRVPAGASMSPGSASGCQGASFQIPVTVTVQR